MLKVQAFGGSKTSKVYKTFRVYEQGVRSIGAQILGRITQKQNKNKNVTYAQMDTSQMPSIREMPDLPEELSNSIVSEMSVEGSSDAFVSGPEGYSGFRDSDNFVPSIARNVMGRGLGITTKNVWRTKLSCYELIDEYYIDDEDFNFMALDIGKEAKFLATRWEAIQQYVKNAGIDSHEPFWFGFKTPWHYFFARLTALRKSVDKKIREGNYYLDDEGYANITEDVSLFKRAYAQGSSDGFSRKERQVEWKIMKQRKRNQKRMQKTIERNRDLKQDEDIASGPTSFSRAQESIDKLKNQVSELNKNISKLQIKQRRVPKVQNPMQNKILDVKGDYMEYSPKTSELHCSSLNYTRTSPDIQKIKIQRENVVIRHTNRRSSNGGKTHAQGMLDKPLDKIREIMSAETLKIGLGDETQQQFERLLGVFESLQAGTKDLATSSLFFVEGANNIVRNLMFMIPVYAISVGLLLMKLKSWIAFGGAGIITLVLRMMTQSTLGQQCWQQIEPHLTYIVQYSQRRQNRTIAQSAIFEPIQRTSQIMTILMHFVLGLQDRKPIKTLVTTIKDVPRTADGFEAYIKYILGLCQDSYNEIRSQMGYDLVQFVSTQNQEIDDWMLDVRQIFDDQMKDKLQITPENADKVFKLVSKGNVLFSRFGSRREFSNVLTQFRNSLDKVKQPFMSANLVESGHREPPLCILFQGRSGVGKSYLVYPFVNALLARTLPDDQYQQFKRNTSNFIYARQHEHKYWDAYRGQRVTVFDDFGQVRDTEGNIDNEMMDIIRCCQSFPNVLHMADLESKGNNYFRSKLIVASTNLRTLDYQNIKSINEPQAVRRRFDMVLHLVPRDEYCTEETVNGGIWDKLLDYDKVPANPNFDVCHYVLKNMENNQVVRYMDFEETIDYCQDIISRRNEQWKQYGESIDAVKDSFRVRAQMESWEELEKIAKTEFSRQAELDINNVHFIELSRVAMRHGFSLWYVRQVFPQVFEPVSQEERMRRLQTVLSSEPLIQRLRSGYVTRSQSFNDGLQEIKSFPQKLRNSVHGFFSRLEEKYPFIKQAGIYLSMIIGGMGFIAGIISLVFYFKHRSKQRSKKAKAQGEYVQQQRILHRPRINRYIQKPQQAQAQAQTDLEVRSNPCAQICAEAQSGVDLNGQAIAMLLRKKSTYMLLSPGWTIEQNKKLGYVQFIKGRIFLVPKHFCEQIKVWHRDGHLEDNGNFTLVNLANESVQYQIPFEVFINYKQCTRLKVKDIVSCEAPRSVSDHTDIVDKFLTEKQILKDRELFVRIDLKSKESRDSRVIAYTGYADYLDRKEEIYGPTGVYEVRECLTYHIPTIVGDCGAAICCMDSTLVGGRVVGLHVAGDEEGNGFGVIITQEMLKETLAQYGKQIRVRAQADLQYKPHDITPFNGCFVPAYGHELLVRAPKETQIVKTKLYGAWGPSKHKPAMLKAFSQNGVLIEPKRMAVEKYGGPVLHYDEDLVQSCAYDWLKQFTVLTKAKTRRIYDFKTAIRGVPGERFIQGIPRQTSPGFPLQVQNKCQGKHLWFGEGQEYSFESHHCIQLEQDVKEIINLCRQYERPEVIYVDFLKDERREIAKVDAGKTRLISACPLAYFIAVRQYFMSFSVAVMESRVANGCAVGLNVYSDDWTMLAKMLSTKGNQVFAGDFSGFDCSEQPQVHRAIVDIINDWYDDGPQNRAIREVLWQEVFNSKHIHGSNVYWWTHSLPSGHPLTTIINSIYNNIVFRMCWVEAHGGNVDSLQYFREHTYLITYGDDSVMNVSKEKEPIFNQIMVQGYMAKFGLKYTPESKGQEYVPSSRKLGEVAFLKRAFRYEQSLDCYVAPLEMTSILEMPYWMMKNDTPIQTTKQNMEKAFQEIALHGDEVFKEYFPKFSHAYRSRLGEIPELWNRDKYLQRCMSIQDFY